MVNIDKNVHLKDSIGAKLLKAVFSVYIIVAIIITSTHMITEYRRVRKNVIDDLNIFNLNLGPAVGIAVWDADIEQMRRILEGLIKSPVILGVKVTDSNGREVGCIGNAHQEKNSEVPDEQTLHLGGGSARVTNLNFTFPIFYEEDEQIYSVGNIEFFSDESVVFNKVKYGFLYIIFTAILKVIVLWVVFLFYCRRILQRPLAKLTEAAGKINFETLENIEVDIQTKGRNELKQLEDVFKTMITKLLEGRKQEEEVNMARFGHIFQESLNEIYLFNADTLMFSQANKAAYNNLGYTEEEMKKLTPLDLKPEFTLETFQELTKPLRAKQTDKITFETVHKRKDGSLYNIEAHLQNITLGKENLFVAIILDISERKQVELQRKIVEQQLRQSQKIEAIGLLAGGIAHDFNNLIGVIAGNISFLKNYYTEDNEIVDVLSDVQDVTTQAQKLTHQLLTFAKGGAPIKKAADIAHIIKESAQFVTRGTKIKCKFEVADDLWAAEVDEGQISQVISNLVINANQAMPEGGVVSFKADNARVGEAQSATIVPGKYVKIDVIDQGIGIPEKHIEKIFDPYFSTKQKGSGLGLATTYSIIQKHEGTITVGSALGKGTIFTIYLPATDKTPDKSKKEEKPVEHLGRGKVLIMDDQEAVLKMFDRLLSRMGYDCFCAEEGSRAVKIFKEAHSSGKPFDLVILDLTIPGGMGGAETIPELMKIDPEIKAIVSSGYSNDPVMADFKEYGFSGVIPKGFTMGQVSTVIKEVLG